MKHSGRDPMRPASSAGCLASFCGLHLSSPLFLDPQCGALAEEDGALATAPNNSSGALRRRAARPSVELPSLYRYCQHPPRAQRRMAEVRSARCQKQPPGALPALQHRFAGPKDAAERPAGPPAAVLTALAATAAVNPLVEPLPAFADLDHMPNSCRRTACP